MRITILILTALTLGLISCSSPTPEPSQNMSDIQQRLAKYTTVKLEADLSVLEYEPAAPLNLVSIYWAYRNRDAYAGRVHFAQEVPENDQILLFDAQTPVTLDGSVATTATGCPSRAGGSS